MEDIFETLIVDDKKRIDKTVLRFVLKRKHGFEGHYFESIVTTTELDLLKDYLTRCGYDVNNGNMEVYTLIGVEVV